MAWSRQFARLTAPSRAATSTPIGEDATATNTQQTSISAASAAPTSSAVSVTDVGMTHPTNTPTPVAVERALQLAEQHTFKQSCLPEVGRLLRVLVAGAGAGSVGEIGTGCGVGAAWLLSGLRPEQHLYSAEVHVSGRPPWAIRPHRSQTTVASAGICDPGSLGGSLSAMPPR